MLEACRRRLVAFSKPSIKIIKPRKTIKMVNPQQATPSVQNYTRMIQLMCTSSVEFALYGKDKTLKWASANYREGEGPLPTDELLNSIDGFHKQKSASDMYYYAQAIDVFSVEDIAFVQMQSDSALEQEEIASYSHQLRATQVMVSEREALKLLYEEGANELQHVHYSCDSGRDINKVVKLDKEMPALLADCMKSMALDGCFFYFNDDKSLYSEVTDESVFNDTGLSSERRTNLIQRDFSRLVETSTCAFLLENLSETGVSSAKNKLQKFQIIVTPLLDENKQNEGLMIFVKSVDDLEFNKSDRRLSELMAESGRRTMHARYDSSTGFLKSTAYGAMLQQELVDCKKTSSESSFLVVRLDNLDQAYGVGGVDAGLHVISQISAILGKRVRSRDLAGRLSKNEFALLLKNCKSENAVIVADQILESISDFTFDWQGQAIGIEANVGLVTLSPAFVSSDNLVRAARDAIECARESGKYQAAVFTGLSGKRKELSKISWEHRIYKAVVNSEFRLYCQPIEDTGSYRDGVQRYEMLLRLDSNDGVLVAPYVFIATARRLGLMKYVDKWVVRQAFATAARVNAGHSIPQFRFSVNLSDSSIDQDFANYVIAESEKSGVLTESICFDITESAAMSNLRQTNKFVGLLRRRGFEFALDDFGIGIGAYSSLRNLAIDYVKVNGTLVKNMANDSVSEAIVSSLVKVCRALGIKTIAESVENDAIREMLVKNRVDFVQGFQAGRPRAIEQEFPEILGDAESKVS